MTRHSGYYGLHAAACHDGARSLRGEDQLMLLAPAMRELDSRTVDGIHVRLIWDQSDGRVVVTVSDTKTHEDFFVEVRPGEQPVEVFHHPYAYGAWHGVSACAPSPLTAAPVSLA